MNQVRGTWERLRHIN